MPYTLLKFLGWIVAALAAGLALGYVFWGRRQRQLVVVTNERDRLTALLSTANNDLAERTSEVKARSDELTLLTIASATLTTERDAALTEVASLKAELDVARRSLSEREDKLAELSSMADELHRLSIIVGEHQTMLGDMRARNWNIETKLNDLHGMLDLRAEPRPPLPPAPFPPDVVAGGAALGRSVRLDDLQVIEGIGPKVDEVLQAAGIATWWELAHADVRWLRRILASAGPRFQLQRPDTWAQQARLLALGKWDEFVSLTMALVGGKEV